MSQKSSASEDFAIALAVIGVAAAFFGMILVATVTNLHTSQQHQREIRDVQVACIKAGKSLVHGDCVPVARP